MASNKLDKVNP